MTSQQKLAVQRTMFEDKTEELPKKESSNAKQYFNRFFSKKDQNIFETVQWEKRTASITNAKGEAIFEQKDVLFPKTWSQTATNIVSSKYFYGELGRGRENSLKQLISRVATTIARWGHKSGYFISQEEAHIFYDELIYLLLHQYAAFNSPVWFNCGIVAKPQCSACFINSIEDSLESILDLAKTEGMLFKWGSGAGCNLSTLRSSKEKLSGGGTSSGPVSFMKGFDSFAGAIKSGGKTRRAAKMVILNADHPDIVEFIECKAKEEKKAWDLIDAGYDGSIDGEAYSSVFFQNSNNSVRATDEFMEAVVKDRDWQTKAVRDGHPMDDYRARDLMKKIAEGTHICGDPGMQFDTIMNKWHTCPNSARINASNPCSEYVFVDDSACNLASLNLRKFQNKDGSYNVKAFRHAVSIMITAQEIIVDNAGYPNDKISENSYKYRALGLGYANLGALLMSLGLPYDSDSGRAYAAAVTALMGGQAYQTSAVLAERKEPFTLFEKNRAPMLNVLRMHRDAALRIDDRQVPDDLLNAARETWQKALTLGEANGFKNAQVTVLAPTGTIGFMMDCDTTGIEPDIALVKYKKLVGGGLMKIVNRTIPESLKRLGYSEAQVKEIEDYIDTNDGIEGAPHLKEEHLPIFDCAFKAPNGKRVILPSGHIKMMGAVQPFISGAISKTVNMPPESTVENIMDTYVNAWKLGLKCVAIYREGSKRIQPLNTSKDKAESKKAKELSSKVPKRRKLPDERPAMTHKFSVAGHEGYITVGLYEDGSPGEIFIRMAKEGSTISGLMDTLATSSSIMLQYGVPLKELVRKFSHTRFEPLGITTNPHIRFAKSIIDYIFRWLAYKFLPIEDAIAFGVNISQQEIEAAREDAVAKAVPVIDESKNAKVIVKGTIQNAAVIKMQEDAPPCPDCGAIMIRSGACYKCLECGATSGCS